MIRKHLDVQFNVKSISDEGQFAGYGSVFNVKDSYGDVVIKGAFAKSLAKFKEDGRAPAMLWQHDISEPIGVYTEVKEDDNGLYVEGQLLIDSDPLAKRAHSHLKAGSLSGLSIGYTIPTGGIEYNDEQDVYLLKQIDLWEVSLVTFPANDQARVSDVKSILSSGGIPDARTVERALRDAGFSRRHAKTIMSRGYKGLSERDAPAGSSEIEALSAALSKLL